MKTGLGLFVACWCIALLTSGCRRDNPSTGVAGVATPSDSMQPLSFEKVVVPSGKVMPAQLYAEKSTPAMPGTKVDLVDVGVSPPQVIVSGAIVQAARWKVPGPFQAPKYPASGFVTFSLAENQWAAIKGKDIAVHPSKGIPPTR